MTSDLPIKYTGENLEIAFNARYMIDVGGRAVVGLGTDYDGIGRDDLAVVNASQMQKLAEGFEQYGFTADEIEGICYRNVLDVYKDVL